MSHFRQIPCRLTADTDGIKHPSIAFYKHQYSPLFKSMFAYHDRLSTDLSNVVIFKGKISIWAAG